MNGLSRRSFAESLAVAALAPLIGVPRESIQLASWADAAGIVTVAGASLSCGTLG
jgi:hypothetical protein